MWKGWIIDQSLKDANGLAKLKIIKTNIEENSAGGEKRVWKLHTVEVGEKEIEEAVRDLEKDIRESWYSHFTNGKALIMIFAKKSFRMRLEFMGKEGENGITYFKILPGDKKVWREASEYGTKVVNVDPRYFIKIE